MPYSTKPNTTTYDPRKELPLHLDHKPVYALPYEHFDYVEDTDARFISIGLAQYDPDDVSIKVFRHTGEKWTRQSEELPLHRVIDMTIFLAKTLFDSQNGEVTFPSGTYQHQNHDIVVSREKRNYGEEASYNECIKNRRNMIKGRLNVLIKVLNDLKKQGKV